MHELAFPLLVGLILVALAFDFLNGLHDAANSIATVVATRLISPVKAVLFAAFFNFAAYFLTIAIPELHAVAETIGKGLIDKELVTPGVIFGAPPAIEMAAAFCLGLPLPITSARASSSRVFRISTSSFQSRSVMSRPCCW